MNRIYVVLALFFPLVLIAQDPTIDRNVTVEREYQPVIDDAGKITTLPEIPEPVTTRQRVDYTDFFHPLPLGRFLHSLPMTAFAEEQRKRQDAFVRLGMGNFWNTLGDVHLPVLKKDKDRLDISIQHQGTFGKRKFSQTVGSIDYNHLFKTIELMASVGGTHRFFNYFGANFSGTGDRLPADTLLGLIGDDTHWMYSGQLGFRSLSDKSNFRHNGYIRYNALNLKLGWKEKVVNVHYGFSTLYKKNRLGIEFDLKNLTYEAPVLVSTVFPDYSVLEINPYYLLEKRNASLRLGASVAVSFVTGRALNPSPDIHGEWKVFPKFMTLYGGVGGGFATMTQDRLLSENPWVKPSLRVKDIYTPVKPYIGFNVKPVHFLLIDAFAEYNLIKDQYFFVNDSVSLNTNPFLPNQLFYTNQFTVDYSDASLWRIGGRVSFQYKNLISSSVKVVSNRWKTETIAHAWMKPGWEADWNIDVTVNPNLTISSSFFYEGMRKARLGSTIVSMDPVNDLNLSASYRFNQTFSSYVKLNNVLNRGYEQFPGYEVQGFNFLLGGAVSF
ncbi:MAG: hypothetical protein RBT57_08175 [Paludibacter sp.]|jgi:hypothetical protein|nr:hypothetical protein [Paludibacter sp.]